MFGNITMKSNPLKGMNLARIGRRHAVFLGALMAAAVMPMAPAVAQSKNVVREAIPDLPGRYIYRPANFVSMEKPAPVIVWANGGCSRNDQDWKGLYESWAGAGYVVITVSEPGAKPRPQAEFDRIRKLIAAENAGTAPPRPPRPKQEGGITGATKDALEFQAEAFDWAARSNATSGGAYEGKLDVERIAAAGNSCGGVTSLYLAARDPRVKSVYVLSGSSIGPGASQEEVSALLGTVTAPSIWIVGGPEDAARAAAEKDYNGIRAGTPAVLMRRASYDHAQMTFEPPIRRDAAEIGLTWFDATLRGDPKAVELLTTKGCATCQPADWSIWAKNIGNKE